MELREHLKSKLQTINSKLKRVSDPTEASVLLTLLQEFETLLRKIQDGELYLENHDTQD